MFNPYMESRTLVLVPPHSYSLLFLDTRCQMCKTGAGKLVYNLNRGKQPARVPSVAAVFFNKILILMFFFAPSIPPTCKRLKLKDSAARRQNIAFAASKFQGSRLFWSQFCDFIET